MPREIKDLKEFLSICSRKDARCVKIKKPDAKKGAKKAGPTKFKVRTSRFLYTLVVADKKKADKIQKSIHPTVKQVLVTKRTHAATKNATTASK